MSYFCQGCLDYWRKGEFMSGCDECDRMKHDERWYCAEFGCSRILEVWEPIVDFCNSHGLKAYIPDYNIYFPRLRYSGKKLEFLPVIRDKFSEQQHEFAANYNKDPCEENWNLLHPTTQLLALRV